MNLNLQKFAGTPVKVLARGWTLEIQNASLVWVPVLGLNTLGFDSEKNDADTTTFDDEGWQTHLVASRTRSISLEGFYLEDPDDGTRDPGQVEVETLADAIGQNSLGTFRLTSPSGTVRQFQGSANVTGFGGGVDDPSGWTAEITTSGVSNLQAVVPTGIVASPDVVALTVGQVSDISSLTFTPANATNKNVTYSSDTPSVASVTPEGRIIGVSAGSATVTVTTESGSVTDDIAVTVS